MGQGNGFDQTVVTRSEGRAAGGDGAAGPDQAKGQGATAQIAGTVAKTERKPQDGDTGWRLGSAVALRARRARQNTRPSRLHPRSRLGRDRSFAGARNCFRRKDSVANNWSRTTRRSAARTRPDPRRSPRLARRFTARIQDRSGQERTPAPWRRRKPLYYPSKILRISTLS